MEGNLWAEMTGKGFLEPLEQSKIFKIKLDLYRHESNKGHHEQKINTDKECLENTVCSRPTAQFCLPNDKLRV